MQWQRVAMLAMLGCDAIVTAEAARMFFCVCVSLQLSCRNHKQSQREHAAHPCQCRLQMRTRSKLYHPSSVHKPIPQRTPSGCRNRSCWCHIPDPLPSWTAVSSVTVVVSCISCCFLPATAAAAAATAAAANPSCWSSSRRLGEPFLIAELTMPLCRLLCRRQLPLNTAA